MHRHDNPANIPSPRPASALVAVLALLAAVGATAPEARADHGLCGQPVSSGVEPVAGDALRTLRTAVNVDECMPGGDICACDVDGSGAVRSTDALMVLSRAVDPAVPLACASSCARAVSPADGGPGAGRDLYDAACSSCHSARPYDTTGFAGDIAGRFGLPNNLGTISGAMNGIVLDDMQLAELEAFLMDVTWSPTPTSTTTTTTLPGSSTSTSTTTSTSTSLPSSPTTTLGDLEADGRFLYDVVCASCHRAGSHDTQGYAGDIAGDGDELTNDLGRLSSQMRGIILDDGQIDSLAAFLDSVGGGSGGGGEDDDEGFEGDDDGDDDHGGIDDDGDDDGDDDSDDDHDDDHDDDGFESDDDHGADYGTDRDHDRDDDDEGDDD